MSHAEIDDLAVLALEDSSPDTPEHVREHVASCAECAALVASLADVRRLAGAEPLVAPPAAVRARVMADALGGGAPRTVEPPIQPGIEPTGADEVASRRTARAMRRRGIPLWAAAVAAAAALVVGVALGNVVGDDGSSPEDGATVLAQAELTTVGGTEPRGDVKVEKSRGVVTVHVETSSLEEAGLREVWLLNVDGTRMVSLGFLPRGDDGDFEVPAGLLEEGYRILDISVEPDDGDPTHSGVSVARGELA